METETKGDSYCLIYSMRWHLCKWCNLCKWYYSPRVCVAERTFFLIMSIILLNAVVIPLHAAMLGEIIVISLQ